MTTYRIINTRLRLQCGDDKPTLGAAFKRQQELEAASAESGMFDRFVIKDIVA